eukprot:CAMPEP_0195585970 /NCGR_PEP_ID=MMETSP0814-20130614/28487_1 /TAXON_ID=97485 /ORGANISM="Prymnesium parvum, Strain Texoma1" /LENGTH=115 /DNA_ID=CAMNT_0040724397 /DNA_START=205 /DNA_END=549 /DNA_ORIENTATION=+
MALPCGVRDGRRAQRAAAVVALVILRAQNSFSSRSYPKGTPNEVIAWPLGHHCIWARAAGGGAAVLLRLPSRRPSVLEALRAMPVARSKMGTVSFSMCRASSYVLGMRIVSSAKW